MKRVEVEPSSSVLFKQNQLVLDFEGSIVKDFGSGGEKTFTYCASVDLSVWNGYMLCVSF